MSKEINKLTIRLANNEDFESLFTIWLQGVANSFDTSKYDTNYLKDKLLSTFNKRNGIFNFWVAVDDEGDIQGWQALNKTSYNPFREYKQAESSTYVKIDTRFKGLGKLLLDYVLKEAEKSELHYVIGYVSTSNKAAKRITEETGWLELGIIPKSKKDPLGFDKYFLVRAV